MNKELKRALRAAVLSAGAWAEKAQPEGITTVFPPHFNAGRVALTRAGRLDLVPALLKRINKSTRLDVTSLNDARYLVRHDLA